jgi:hypothetical protein
MEDPDRARRLDEENRERFEIRKEEERMAAEERELEHELEHLTEDVEQAERAIERELRSEHWGHDPERPPSWRAEDGAPDDRPPGPGASPPRDR